MDSALQDGKPFGKWNVQAKVRIYTGQSLNHNKRVALVLDRKTGLVSPQYHVKFDDEFTSIMQDSFDSDWLIKAGFVTRDEDERNKRPNDKAPLRIPGIKMTKSDKVSKGEKEHSSSKRKVTWKNHAINSEQKKLRRSPRLGTGSDKVKELLSMEVKIASAKEDKVQGEVFAEEAALEAPSQMGDIMAMKASTDPNIMYLHQALKEPDKSKFVEAMKKEVRDQMDNSNYPIVSRAKVPKGKTISPAL